VINAKWKVAVENAGKNKQRNIRKRKGTRPCSADALPGK
jgi:hypothetical protein